MKTLGKRSKRPSSSNNTPQVATSKKSGKSKNKDDNNDEAEYEIEKIVGYRFKEKSDTIEFLVRWKGYGADADTWESFDMFAFDAPNIVQKYLISGVFKKYGLPKSSNQEEEKHKSVEHNGKNKGEKAENKENDTKIKIISQL